MGLIIVADDHPLFRDALRQAIDGLVPGQAIEAVGDMAEVEELAGKADEVDLVLLDLAMPGSKGLSGLIRLRAQHPEIPVVVVSATEDPSTIRRALELGASGFIPKSSSMADIRAATSAVLDGEIWAPSGAGGRSEEDVEFAELAARLKP